MYKNYKSFLSGSSLPFNHVGYLKKVLTEGPPSEKILLSQTTAHESFDYVDNALSQLLFQDESIKQWTGLHRFGA